MRKCSCISLLDRKSNVIRNSTTSHYGGDNRAGREEINLQENSEEAKVFPGCRLSTSRCRVVDVCDVRIHSCSSSHCVISELLTTIIISVIKLEEISDNLSLTRISHTSLARDIMKTLH